MCPSEWLQLTGGIFELLGIITVAIGIGETRRAFTDRPSLVGRLLAFVRKFLARFRRRDAKIQAVSAVGTLESAGKIRAVVKIGDWDGVPIEQKLERLRRAAQRHEDKIAELDERLDQETTARETGDKQEERDREGLRILLEERIRHAAAGGLRLQVAGVVAFSLGVILATWGNFIG